MPNYSQKPKNVAKSQAATSKEAINMANRQIWQKEFVADYDQIVKRTSTAPFNGLFNGQPPPNVT